MTHSFFKSRSITSIYIWGMFIVFLFVVLFTALVVYDEYSDFEKKSHTIRKQYIENQKSSIKFDTQRVLKFISHAYEHWHNKLSEEELKTQVISAIEQLYGRQDGTGYIFIYDFNGTNLSDPLYLNNKGKNLLDFKDPNGVEVIKDLITVSQEPEGGFVKYMWTKPGTGVSTPKISYAQAFKPWKWMVGTGVYLDEVEKLIYERKEKLKRLLVKYMMEIFTLTVIFLGIGFAGIALVNSIIRKEIDAFTGFFKQAASRHNTIDAEQIHLLEFKEMVQYINNMVDSIHTREKKLREINLTLENRVEQKTRDISRKNKQLEQEKRFSESLVKAQDSFIKHSIHEINTPLAVIMMQIDMYKIKYGEDKYLSQIEAASKMIANIYDDLSYMVKKDRFVYEKRWIDFSLFLEERIEFFEEIARGNRHRIVYEIEPDISIFFSDIELQRIIDNNLSNAVKYANRNSDIEVSLKKENGNIVLSFLTHSKQIEDTKRIFEPFHQEEDVHGGFGLGLEIVRSICEKECVSVTVTSDSEITIFRYTFSSEKGKTNEDPVA
ncbi:cache domain-containing protein [Sulfurovum riftiae]|uniref:histidine kinase n=1 Tax=Sulfurovum riftiae TaxID=1630136 RepID=A0A151CE55_9BACT|nr:cache domain-containing protein [Sulfurovum riftiae]KYJ85818.1 hypothetical protein AS592_03510 [Sulfurovum riftiae]